MNDLVGVGTGVVVGGIADVVRGSDSVFVKVSDAVKVDDSDGELDSEWVMTPSEPDNEREAVNSSVSDSE